MARGTCGCARVTSSSVQLTRTLAAISEFCPRCLKRVLALDTYNYKCVFYDLKGFLYSTQISYIGNIYFTAQKIGFSGGGVTWAPCCHHPWYDIMTLSLGWLSSPTKLIFHTELGCFFKHKINLQYFICQSYHLINDSTQACLCLKT